MHPPSGVIAFLTDFGYRDPYVAAMKGVALLINPSAKLVDVTHEIPSFDVDAGAFTLLASYRYFPPGTVFVVVVDPGVGSARRAIAIATRNYYFVGPDNGVLIPAAEEDGIELVVELKNPEYWRHPVSASFHGRDVFTPVAAWISRGVPLRCLGSEVDPSTLVKPGIRMWIVVEGACAKLRVIHVDKFGNVVLSQRFEALTRELGLSIGTNVVVKVGGREYRARVSRVFSEVPKDQLVLYRNSFDLAELAINLGSASEALGLSKGDLVEVCRCEELS